MGMGSDDWGKITTISPPCFSNRKPFDVPHETTGVRELKRRTLGVTPLFNAESREHSRGHNKQRRINVMPPWADSLSKSKY